MSRTKCAWRTTQQKKKAELPTYGSGIVRTIWMPTSQKKNYQQQQMAFELSISTLTKTPV